MKNNSNRKSGPAGGSFRTALMAGAAAAALAVGVAAGVAFQDYAYAAQGGNTSKGAVMQRGGSGGGAGKGQMRQGAGSTLEQRILRDDLTAEEDEDSDRPVWAGREGDRDQTPGGGLKGSDTRKGDIYGDLYVILRDTNGVPILNDGGFVQPIAFETDADGNLVPVLDENGDYVLLPLNEEGDIDPTQIPEGETWVAAEVDFGRLSIARSPDMVMDRSLEEAYLALTTADSISLDASGRVVVVVDGVEQTFDSPLINLALYLDLINYGNLILRDADGDPILDADGNVQPLLPTSILPDSETALSQADLDLAATLFAAAGDKTSTVTVDMVVYMNTILGVDGTLEGDYVDFSTYSYDRADAYEGITTTVLVQQPDGSYLVQEVDVLDAVFGGEDGEFDATTENVTATMVDGFAAASDDALQVLEFIHEFAPPADLVSTTN